MKFKTLLKSTVAGMVMGSAFLMSGCSTLPSPKKVITECEFNSQGEWKCKVIGTWQKSSGNYNNLAQIMNENFALDFSNSPNELLADQFNIGNITLKSNGVLIATKVSTYQKNGHTIVAANSNELGNWLASYNGQADEITLTIDQLTFEAVLGTNIMVMEFTHNGSVFAGASASDYISPFSPEALQINSN